MLATKKRTTVAITGVAGLLAGALVMVPSISTAAPAAPAAKSGAIEEWGTNADGDPMRVTHSTPPGPWTAVAVGRSATFGISYDKSLHRLAGTGGDLDVPSDLASAQVTAVSAGGTFAGAVKADGSVQFWGSARGVSLAPLSVADLGGKATDVAVGRIIMILLDNGQVRVVGSSGLEPLVTDGGANVTTAVEVKVNGNNDIGFARLQSGELVGFSNNGDTLALPVALSGDNPTDPAVSFAMGSQGMVASTQSGAVYTFDPGTGEPLPSIFPAAEVEGEVVDVETAGDYYAAVTDEKEVVVWGKDSGASDYAAMTTVPQEVDEKAIVDLVSGPFNFATVVSNPLVDVAEKTKPTIAGTSKVNETLTGTPATFDGFPDAITNKWLADGEAISGATGLTYKLTAAELGKHITFESTATRVEGNALVVSTSTSVGPVGATAPAASKTVVSAPSKAYGSTGTATVTVSNTAGRPIAGTITLTGAGAAQTKALVSGKATFALAKSLAPKAYTLSAKYNGSAQLIASTGAVKYTVAKGKVKAPAYKTTKSPTSKKKGKATVTVTAPSGLAKATGKVTVTLKKGSSKKLIKATLSGGKKSITLPKLKKGTYKVTIFYYGDSKYGSAKSKTYSLKIKK